MPELTAQWVGDYASSRQQALKRIVKRLRKEAHYSQEDVASFLGCSRTRITEIEREDSSVTYTLGELELLTILFGRHPLDLLRLAGQDAIELAEMMTAKQTRGALLGVTDCVVPPGIAKILRIDEMPGDLIFAPGAQLLASIVDAIMAQDWHEEEPYEVTILCWASRSGKLVAQTQLPYAEEVAPLDDGRVVIFTAPPQEAYQAWEPYERYGQMLVWDTRTGAIEEKMTLPYPVQRPAVSPDGSYLAAYLPDTTTVQVWRTQDWHAIHAYELEVEPGSSDPSRILRQATDCNDLSTTRKMTPRGFEHRASRVEFLNSHVLVIGFGEEILEIDLLAPAGYPSSHLGPLREFPRVTHTRDDEREIAVRSIAYDFHAGGGDSKIELYYQVAIAEQGYPPMREVRVTRWLSGQVNQPVILDETCVLAWVSYNTPYRWGRVHKRRLALVNLVSGRVVLLEDQGRWQAEDNQMAATISPGGGMVAYWTFSASGDPRLAIQHIDSRPLRRKGFSLRTELEKSRERWREVVSTPD